MLARSAARLLFTLVVVCGACGEDEVAHVYEDVVRPADPWPDLRYDYTATPLLDGRILLAGGVRGEVGEREYPTGLWIFDPTTGGFVASRASLQTGRNGHTAALLPDGRVVIAGGFHFDSPPNSSVLTVELYDPVADSVSAGGEALAPVWQIATLPDGDLIGFNFSPRKEDELVIQRYELARASWVRLDGAPSRSHGKSQVVGLPGGEVLVLGALDPMDDGLWPINVATLYDPVAGRFHDEQVMDGLGGTAEYVDAAASLADGRVLVLTGSLFAPLERNLYLYEPDTHEFSTVTEDLPPGGGISIAALLDGRGLLVGGQPWVDDDFDHPVRDLHIFDPETGSLDLLPTRLSAPRSQPTVAVSRSGPVFIASDASVELFE